MFPRSRRVYRLMLLLLPPAERRRDRDGLEAALVACLERERARLGPPGLIYAWLCVLLDTLTAAIVLRLDARRRRRITALARHSSTGDTLMATIWQELRYSIRVLARAPGFSAAIVLTLALAIGATTAVFSVVNAVLLRSMPFRDPGRLVVLYEAIGKSGPVGFSAPDYKALAERARSFESIGVFGSRDFELSGVQSPERITAARISASLFDVLGVSPALGRNFTVDEDEGRRPVVILSDALWRRSFGADPGVLGRAVMLDRQAYTVVGIMPRTVTFPNRGPRLNNKPADLFVPISFSERELTGFGSMYNNSVLARLRDGVTIEAADAEARAIAASLIREIYPSQIADLGWSLSASAVSLRGETVGNVERLLYILLGAIGVVLLIACADVANLMLTRAVGRGREIAVRSALGAGRLQLGRQVLVEAGVLSVAGGLLGVVVAYWSMSLIVSMAPVTIPRLNELSIDLRVLGFALGVTVATALACGLAPAIELARRPAGESLKEGTRSATGGPSQRWVFGALVTTQFALAIVLLVAGGLLVRSFNRLMAVETGFKAERVLTLSTSLPARAYLQGSNIRGFYEQLLENVGRVPGVTAAGLATDLPLSVRERRAFTIEVPPAASAELSYTVAHDWVIGNYFEALGIELRRGRFLSMADTAQSEPVVVINETMARQFWPGQDAVGQRMAWGGARNHGRWMRIVGVVGDVKQGPLATATVAQSYQPWTQQIPDAAPSEMVFVALRSLVLVVRTSGEPSPVASAVQGQVRALDPSLPVAQVKTMETVVSESAAPQRFNTILLSAFAAVALVLAALGIGGVLATTVSRRTREIGLRMALGANRGDVLGMIVRQGMSVVAIGLLMGVSAAFLATRLMSSLLFEISAHDPMTFAAATALLVLVALAACAVPAWRASRVDPMNALRVE